MNAVYVWFAPRLVRNNPEDYAILGCSFTPGQWDVTKSTTGLFQYVAKTDPAGWGSLAYDDWVNSFETYTPDVSNVDRAAYVIATSAAYRLICTGNIVDDRKTTVMNFHYDQDIEFTGGYREWTQFSCLSDPSTSGCTAITASTVLPKNGGLTTGGGSTALAENHVYRIVDSAIMLTVGAAAAATSIASQLF